jgi:hypothetical protein
VAYDLEFGGIADETAEGHRIAREMEGYSVLMMGNHGVTVSADTVDNAFEEMYYFERACQTMVLAYSTGQPLSILPDEVARKVSRGWDTFKGMGMRIFNSKKRSWTRRTRLTETSQSLALSACCLACAARTSPSKRGTTWLLCSSTRHESR